MTLFCHGTMELNNGYAASYYGMVRHGQHCHDYTITGHALECAAVILTVLCIRTDRRTDTQPYNMYTLTCMV